MWVFKTCPNKNTCTNVNSLTNISIHIITQSLTYKTLENNDGFTGKKEFKLYMNGIEKGKHLHVNSLQVLSP